jgi:LysM repeat protein
MRNSIFTAALLLFTLCVHFSLAQYRMVSPNDWQKHLEAFALFPKIENDLILESIRTTEHEKGNWYNFLPAQAVRFGLTINDSIDERLHPYLSALAYKRWQNNKQCPVPAIKDIPEKYLQSLENWNPDFGHWIPVKGRGPFPIESMGKFSSASKYAWKNANPHLIYDFVMSDEQYIFIPSYEEARHDSIFTLAREHYAEKLRQLEEKEPEKDFYEISVKSGENLSVIARREKVSVSDIIRWNRMPGDRIYPGQKLLIGGTRPQNESMKPAPAKTTSKPSSENTITYTVKEGDSLWLISEKFAGVTIEDIMRINQLKSERINVGQILYIPKNTAQ